MNIAATVAAAFQIARGIAPEAFPEVTLRLGLTVENEIVNDGGTDSWKINMPIRPVAYFDKDERDGRPATDRLKRFAFPVSELPADAYSDADQTGEILDGTGYRWEVYLAERDPTGSLVIFHTRRQ